MCDRARVACQPMYHTCIYERTYMLHVRARWSAYGDASAFGLHCPMPMRCWLCALATSRDIWLVLSLRLGFAIRRLHSHLSFAMDRSFRAVVDLQQPNPRQRLVKLVRDRARINADGLAMQPLVRNRRASFCKLRPSFFCAHAVLVQFLVVRVSRLSLCGKVQSNLAWQKTSTFESFT